MNVIPAHLHADLSPLLVRAGEWPDARDLVPVPPHVPADAADEAARLARTRPVPPDREQELERLLRAVERLVHPALRAGRLERHLYWTADRALYFRLRQAAARTERTDDPDDPLPSGWASFAPTAGAVQAFCIYAHRSKALGPAGPGSLLAFLGAVLSPPLAQELAQLRPQPAPAVRGPGEHAAIFRLDPAGHGMAYSYVYGYTNGQRVVAAVQPLVHRTR